MQTTLTIKDLSTSLELDRKAMSAVHGGQDNQAIGTSQSNLQVMFAAANVGNGSLFWARRLSSRTTRSTRTPATRTPRPTSTSRCSPDWACRAAAESASGEVGVAADPHPTEDPGFREGHHEHHDHH